MTVCWWQAALKDIRLRIRIQYSIRAMADIASKYSIARGRAYHILSCIVRNNKMAIERYDSTCLVFEAQMTPYGCSVSSRGCPVLACDHAARLLARRTCKSIECV